MANNSAPTIEGAAEEDVRRLADALEPAIRGTKNAPSATRSVTEAFARVLLAGGQPLRTAFLARALNAIAALTTQLEESELGNATGASTDYEVLLYALEAPEALHVLRRPDPLAAARLRGIEARARLLDAAGGPLPVDPVTKHLPISRQACEQP